MKCEGINGHCMAKRWRRSDEAVVQCLVLHKMLCYACAKTFGCYDSEIAPRCAEIGNKEQP